MVEAAAHVVGGGFLLETCGSRATFIPENLNEQQRELAAMTARFAKEEALAANDRIEAAEPGLVIALLKKAGELGLLMAEIPETHGGLGLGKVDATVIAENMAYQGSFSVAFLCHTGIGTLPVLHYGTGDQKRRYLPKLATGELIGAYALTEAEAGSDAMAGRAKAVLSPDGQHYLLTGEKIYCTNGGIAELVTLFAKVDGDKFTAFLVERTTPGLSVGPDEHKMGNLGTSTASIILEEAKVPVANILGEIGRGHKVAFNTLNVGRFKLGAACAGTCKRLIGLMAPQANARHQFGKPIASFELIRQKIARSVCRTYLLESLVYRYAGDLDAEIAVLDPMAPDHAEKLQVAIAEHSIEAAIAKVYGSEALAFVADEAVQLFGGSGFIRGFAVEQAYRDCRINRIFEGTNEICRLLIPATLIKRAMAGRLPLMERLSEILTGLKAGFLAADPHRPFAALVDQVEGVKRLAIYVAGVALQKFGEGIRDRQAIVATTADLIIAAYAFDAGVARAIALHAKGDAARAGRYAEVCAAFLAEELPLLAAKARQALINTAGGAEAEYVPYLKALGRIVSPIPLDTDAAYDRIAARILEREEYDL